MYVQVGYSILRFIGSMFSTSPGVSAENINKAQQALSANSKLVQELSNSGNSWTLKTSTNAGEKEITFNLGEEFSSATLDGRAVKVRPDLE